MNWKTNYWQKTNTCGICCQEDKVCKRIYISKLKEEPWGAFVCKECESGETMKAHMKRFPDVELRRFG